jgi:hypothetical protein
MHGSVVHRATQWCLMRLRACTAKGKRIPSFFRNQHATLAPVQSEAVDSGVSYTIRVYLQRKAFLSASAQRHPEIVANFRRPEKIPGIYAIYLLKRTIPSFFYPVLH